MSDRALPLPCDLNAEAAVLSAVLIEPSVLPEVGAILQPVSFYADANRRIFEAMIDIESRGEPVDVVAVASFLRGVGRLDQIGGTPYLAQIADATPAVANVASHALIVREKWRLREVISKCQKFATQGYTTNNVQLFIEDAERELSALARLADASETERIREIIRRAIQTITESEQRGGSITGLATGFSRLDRQCSGLHAGELYIVAARPGMGKTSFVLGIARNVARSEMIALAEGGDAGAGVLFCSLEMPKEQLGARLLSSEARVELADIRSGKIGFGCWPKLTDAAADLAKLPLWIDDEAAMSLAQVRAKIGRVRAENGGRRLSLVVIDYLQLMRGSGDAGNREQEISGLSRGLKALAKQEGIPIIALSQLNRAVEARSTKDKRPQLSDLRESGAIEQDADAVLFIYRDEYYFKESEAKGIAEIILAKQRNGPTGTVLTKFSGEYTRFDNLEAETFDAGKYDDFPGDHWSS